MARENSRFPYRLVVLGFPLSGGLFLGVAFGWSWAIGGGRPPEPLAVPVEVFFESVAVPVWSAPLPDLARHVDEIILLVVSWELAWLAVGIGVALLAWFVNLLVPRGKGEER